MKRLVSLSISGPTRFIVSSFHRFIVSSFHRFIMATTYDNIFSMIEKEARKKNCSFAIGRSHIVKLKAIFKEAFGKVFIKRIIFNF